MLLDGRSITEIPPDQRAARTGYLPQDPYLFSGSVLDNVLFMSPQSDYDSMLLKGGRLMEAGVVSRALTIASLKDDVSSFPAGMNTEIGELGIRVSGGQRQRIALARAVAAAAPKTPGLIVLDDPFSAVDVDTEATIVTALRDAFGPQAPPEQQSTIILCSHRLAAFPQADLVVVLENGRIVEQGTHAALLQAEGLYSRIFKAQSKVVVGKHR